MGLDLWFREDVTRTLASIREARRTALDDDNYTRGFEDALRAVEVAFGIRSPTYTVRMIPPPPIIDTTWQRLPSPWE